MITDYPDTNVMLGRLGVVYGQPDTPQPLGFFREAARVLHQYDDDELNEATDRLLATRKHKTWPSLAEMAGHCEDARAVIRTRMAAGANQQRLATQAAQNVPTQQETLAGQICVDRWANGQERITATPQQPGRHPKGFQPLITPEGAERLIEAFRGWAVAIRARRGRDVV